VVIGVFNVPGVDAEVIGKEKPDTGVAVGVKPVEAYVSKLKLGIILDGVSMVIPCSDVLLCCCWTTTIFDNPREAGRRVTCCGALLFGAAFVALWSDITVDSFFT
jgi:hypothetical protein